MILLPTALVDTNITALREYATRYEQPGYEGYDEEVRNAKELIRILEANRQGYEDTHPHNTA